MQQLLVSWLLIGVLLLPADQVGPLQALIGVPGIFLMLWGGASADRTDARTLLIRVYAFSPLLPLFLIAIDQVNALSVTAVALWGLGMSVVTSFSMPAQQAILNRVSGAALQQGVSASTAVGFLVQMGGLMLAGQMDRIGLSAVLLVQALCLAIGALAIRRISPAEPPEQSGPRVPALKTIAAGFRATFDSRVIAQILTINFASSIFNAGAFMTVFPFIIKRVYDGDAALLAIMMTVFYAGATASNLLMYKLMPFQQPGRLFLLMQLSRIVILLLLWIEPSWGLLVVATIAWGVNMGFTTTLARTIVQESAAAEFRGRILSVFTLGMMGSAPIGAILLGIIIEAFGTLNALLPAMVLSFALFTYGVLGTGVWSYRSPAASQAVGSA
jgi:predicted MFS family arabinose efflux permease